MNDKAVGQSSSVSRRQFVTGVGAGVVGGLVVGGAAGGVGGWLAGDSGSASSGGGGTGGAAIKIGSSLPLTGFAAADGLEQKQAATLAIEEWNARGGVLGRQIEYVIEDVADMAPETMLSNFRSLTTKSNVDAIINGYLLFSGPEYDVVAESGTPYIHVNTLESNPEMYKANPEKYWMTFMADPSQKWYGLGFPAFVASIEAEGKWKPANKQIAIVTASDPYATGIADNLKASMEKFGWTVSLFEKIVAPLNEWGPILQKIRSNPPDVIFVSDLTLGDIASFTKQFSENPTPSLVYGQYVPSLKEYIDLSGPAANGVIWSTVCGIAPGTQADDYRAAYEKRWGVKPGGSIGGILYDEVNLYLTALAVAGGPGDRKKVCDVINRSWYKGLCGVYHFTNERTVAPYPDDTADPASGQPHLYVQIQNGRQKIIYPKPYTESVFELPAWI
ncbi:MAG: ABC transporter substrate-binding protein [Actinobacteria bacterium]|nr:ABC transporter substrate-binding protein [Actinomycetota bacterium]